MFVIDYCRQVISANARQTSDDFRAMTNAKYQMENGMAPSAASRLGSQGDYKDRFDAGDLAEVRDHHANIGVMIRRRFDRNRSLLHMKLP
jgi:hypothetical protein